MKKLRDLKIGEVMDLCRVSHCNRGCPLSCGDRACLLDSVPANWEDSCELGRPAGKWGNVKILEPAEIHAPAEVQEDAEKRVTAGLPAEMQEPTELKVLKPDAEGFTEVSLDNFLKLRKKDGIYASLIAPPELRQRMRAATSWDEFERSLAEFLKSTKTATDQGTPPGKVEQKTGKKQKAKRKTADQQGPAEKPDDPGLSKPGKKTKRKATDQQESL